MARRASGESRGLDPSYSPEQAIVRQQLINGDATDLAVVFGPWHGGSVFPNALARRIAGGGRAVLALTFHDDILSNNLQTTIDSFENIKNKIAHHLFKIRDEYEKISFIGLSLGNVALAMVAREFPDFDSAQLVLTADSLANSMWNGIRTSHIRDDFEQQGITAEDVTIAWKNLAPSEYANDLRGKTVSVVQSANDEVIPTVYQQQYIDDLKRAGVEPRVRTTTFGHYLTTMLYCLTPEFLSRT